MNNHNRMTRIGEMTHFDCLGEDDAVLYPMGLNEMNIEYLELALKVGSALLGKYKIVKVIDVNQFGFVYLVEKNISNKKRFIVKEFFPPKYVKRGARDERIVKSSLSLDDMVHYNYMKEIFASEADNLKTIMQNPHSNIIKPVGVEENRNNTIYIIFQEEESIVLQDYLKEKKETLKNAEILHIAKDMLNALEHLHSLGICHLDIKPTKIMIGNDSTPILFGFEASRVFYDEEDNIDCGGYTPVYAAPEQTEGMYKANQHTDIYSMGAVIYKIITGAPPVMASKYMNKNGYDALEHKDFSGKYDITLLGAVDKALNDDNKERFRDVDSFRRAISGLSPLGVKKEKKAMPYIIVAGVFLMSLLGYLIFDKGEVIENNMVTEIQSQTKEEKTNVTDHKEYSEANRSTVGNIYTKVLDKKTVNKEASEEIAEEEQSLKDENKSTVGNIYAKVLDNKTVNKEASEEIVEEEQSLKDENKSTSIKSDLPTNQVKQAIEKKTIREVNVTIAVSLPEAMDKTVVMVNGSAINNGKLLAKEDEVYKIKIYNPYFKDLELERTFEELSAFPEQRFTLRSGKSKIYITGLPSDTMIKVYRQNSNEKPKEMDVQIKYRDYAYEMLLKSGDNRYLTFEHKEYKLYKTKVFSVKNAEAITQVYMMKKKVKEEKNESFIKPSVKKNIVKETKIVKTKEILKEKKK